MSLNTEQTRTAILARLTCKAPDKKLGRTQVMKLFYFIQELKGVQLGYDFRLFTYGPFDSEVLSDLATSCNLGIVNERTVIYSRGYGYEITSSNSAELLSDKLETADKDLADKIDDVVHEFGGLSASELELRSTILFVDREFIQSNTKATNNEIASRVHSIKPHFSNSIINSRIKDMESKKWLASF